MASGKVIFNIWNRDKSWQRFFLAKWFLLRLSMFQHSSNFRLSSQDHCVLMKMLIFKLTALLCSINKTFCKYADLSYENDCSSIRFVIHFFNFSSYRFCDFILPSPLRLKITKVGSIIESIFSIKKKLSQHKEPI